MKTLKRAFFTGLLVLLPVTLTLWLLAQLLRFVENILGPVIRTIPWLKESYRPGLGVVSLVALILLVGAFAGNILGRRILAWFNRVLERVPLFNRVYLMIKGISDSVLGGPEQKKFFSGVVLVPFPDERTKTIGFITAAPEKLVPGHLGVFVPTVPNITTGFYLLFPRERVEILDIPVEEGLKIVLSFGITGRVTKDEAAEHQGKLPGENGQ